jgi:hypothetical protein
MTPTQRAKEIAALANECCYRSDGYEEHMFDVALKHLTESNADMLAALRAVRAYHNGGAPYSVEPIDAAIAKAEGKS